VWAIEQDKLSKRDIPCNGLLPRENAGQDVFVPWVLATRKDHDAVGMKKEDKSTGEPKQVFNRYYHMFSEGELHELVVTATEELGLEVGNELNVSADQGVEIVQCEWERSNYYIEIRRWRR